MSYRDHVDEPRHIMQELRKGLQVQTVGEARELREAKVADVELGRLFALALARVSDRREAAVQHVLCAALLPVLDDGHFRRLRLPGEIHVFSPQLELQKLCGEQVRLQLCKGLLQVRHFIHAAILCARLLFFSAHVAAAASFGR